MKAGYTRPVVTKVILEDRRPAPVWLAWVLTLAGAFALGYIFGCAI